jgi:cytochrome c biogenesis protein CcmG, thiol:disulfide interchange protein DsbE
MKAMRTAPGLACLTLAARLVLAVAPFAWPSPAQCAPPARGADAPTAAVESAPDFERPDLAGHTVRFSDYRGQVVLLTFWASWCVPCRAEAPVFSAWQAKYHARGLQIIGVSMDDDPAAASAFAATLKLSYPNVIGDAELGRLYGGILGLPTAFLINPSGRIVARYRGELNFQSVEANIKTLLPNSRS